MKTTTLQSLLAVNLLALTALCANTALAATPYANATVEGALTPGVYGRIEIGTAPPPPLIYAQPVIIQRQPVLVQQAPLYLHVPPGHAKKWSKHCARYNACGQPVYFVRVQGDDDYERGQYKEYKDKKHGKGHGKGHDKDRHDH
ncbi:MAG: hypothetical protein V4646_01050 [Pseudomonadota bacterium]